MPKPFSLTIVPGPEFFDLNGVKGRVWEGWTPDGTPCRVLVFAVQVPTDADTAEFDEALKEVPVVFVPAEDDDDGPDLDPERN